MRRSWTWAGMVFQTEPGSSRVRPTTSWQDGHHVGVDELVDGAGVRGLGASRAVFEAASAMRMRRVGWVAWAGAERM